MAKKDKKAANNAAPVVNPTENTNAVTATVTKSENNKADKNQQVADKPVTKKEDAKPQGKAEKPSAQKETKPAKKDKTPTILPETVSEEEAAINTLAKSVGTPTNQGSSTDAKAMLAFVGHQRFTNNEDLKKNYPEQYNAINQAINAVWFLGMIGVQQEMINMQSEGKLELIVSPEQIMPLQEMAHMFGVKLATPKALPGAVDGQMSIDFSPEATHVPEELKDSKIGKIQEPELDIEKVGSDHELICAALDYLLRKDRNLIKSLMETIEWYRKLCINNATTADEKLAVDNRPINEWIDEIFHLVPVAGLMSGIGRAVYLSTKRDDSPIAAHCLIRAQIPGIPEEDIARIVRTFIQENYRIGQEDKIDANGNVIKKESASTPVEDKAIQATMGNLGLPYINSVMAALTASVPENATDEQLNEIDENRKKARKIISIVRSNYYPGKVEPTNEQLRFAIGKIINYYRSPLEQIAEFSAPLPKLVGEYPESKKEEPAGEKKK